MKKLFFFFIFLTTISCEHKSKNKTMVRSWHGSMQGLAKTLKPIMPQLISSSYELTKEDEQQLNNAIVDLKKYSNNLDSEQMNIPSHDPSLRYVAQDFQKEIRKIQRTSSREGDIEQTQTDLRQLTRYCVACHTRSPSQSSSFSGGFENSLNSFSEVEKGEIYAAFRQYEKALIHLEAGLTNRNWAQQHPELWNKAAMLMLSITVRVHDDPNLTLEMISRLFDTKAYPRQLTAAARVWRQDTKQWVKDKNQQGLKGLTSLLKLAKQREKQLTNSGLILNLRALARLNRYLKASGHKARQEQLVLYYTGVLTKRLQALNFGGFPESYFQACRAINPKSKVGAMCQMRLK